MEKLYKQRTRALAQDFEDTLKSFNSHRDKISEQTIPSTFAVIRKFDEITAQLYSVRNRYKKTSRFRTQLEEYVSDVTYSLVGFQKAKKEKLISPKWKAKYRRIWVENLPLFFLTAFVFAMSLIMGAIIPIKYPDFTIAIIGPQMMETIIEQREWFTVLNESPLLGGLAIAMNNIKVSVLAFVAGMAFGIGGLLLLIYNGLSIGAVYGFCYVNRFDKQLLGFITSHGALELTIIVAAVFASFLVGRVFYMRPLHMFRKRMKTGAQEAGTIIYGAVPWLLLAGALESFVSPNPIIPYSVKLLASLIAIFAFLYWTFKPVKGQFNA